MSKENVLLRLINPDHIKPNPDNPRLIFREDEMNQLLDSIKEVGIKVPLSVYQDDQKFVLIDGERRWRCSKKLNLTTVPAHIQPKPTRLENLLMMFNIHNVRVDWDPMPMAFKLADVQEMLKKSGKPFTPKDISVITGVRLASVRRALELLELPRHYQQMLLREAEKPRELQRIKADLFIEIYKSLHVIEKYTPEVMNKVSKSEYINKFVNKYTDGVIDNVVAFRNVSKIARGELAGISKKHVAPIIVRLVKDKTYSIDQAFQDTVKNAYLERDIVSKIQILKNKLLEFKTSIPQDLKNELMELKHIISKLLEK